MALSMAEIMEMAREQRKQSPEKKSNGNGGRVKIVAGSKKIGDVINGKIITGFGKTWSQHVPDHETSVYGLQPGKSYNVNMQYAYF